MLERPTNLQKVLDRTLFDPAIDEARRLITPSGVSRVVENGTTIRSEDYFQRAFENAAKSTLGLATFNSGTRHQATRKSMVRELPSDRIGAPVTKHGKKRGNVDLVEMSSTTGRQVPICGLELKCMPLPHWEGPNYYLGQLCEDVARLHYSMAFASRRRSWIIVLVHGPWITNYRNSTKESTFKKGIKRVFHDQLHRDYSRHMITEGFASPNDRLLHSYKFAAAKLVGWDLPYDERHPLMVSDRFLVSANVDNNTAIAAVAVDHFYGKAPVHRRQKAGKI